ncbi:hypothetical protein HHL24_08550 [Paraburkholderia sp. RP-4-7]|uniref:Uncharacterized protein n=1 Tax=Paraburkholderia polaris TaxID=2728848 RepID=A0A848I6H0_9BURK|nr:hypothetical protein [Paraburkholderia polaris]NML97997.1 hypothetical protein [Paraburkholderia polaris]
MLDLQHTAAEASARSEPVEAGHPGPRRRIPDGRSGKREAHRLRQFIHVSGMRLRDIN